MVVKIDLDVSGIDDFATKMAQLDTGLQVEVHEALQIGANLLKADAQFEAPYVTGFLRSTIYAVALATWVFKVGAWAFYAKYQEFGTRPHIIRAKPGGVLVFEVHRKTVFAKFVRHPGIKPVRFMQKAIKNRWPQIRDVVNRAIRIAIRSASR